MLKLLLLLFLVGLVVALFLYSRLLPYKDRLLPKYQKSFRFYDKIFSPVLNMFRGMFKPAVVGNGVAVDTAQIVLLVLLLFLIMLF